MRLMVDCDFRYALIATTNYRQMRKPSELLPNAPGKL